MKYCGLFITSYTNIVHAVQEHNRHKIEGICNVEGDAYKPGNSDDSYDVFACNDHDGDHDHGKKNAYYGACDKDLRH